MTPYFARKDSRYLGSGNAELFGEYHAGFAIGATLANVAHLLFSQFGKVRRFAAYRPIVTSLFYEHIMKVISLGTRPKMSRITTGGLISIRTIVTNTSAMIAAIIRNWPIVKFIAETVGGYFLFGILALATNIKVAVAIFVSAARPEPTVVGAALIDFLPEAFLQWLKRIVTTYKSIGLTSDLSAFLSSYFGDWCRQATSAFTQLVKIKLGLGKLWGMIHDVFRASNATDQAGELQLARHFLLGCYLSKLYHISGQLPRLG